MKKSNSEVVIDSNPSNRKTLLRNPSLKSTITHHPNPDRESHAVSLAKIPTNPKHVLKPHPSLKIDTQRLVFYGGDRGAQAVSLQNTGKEMLRISLALPRTKYFQLC
jgi:hypothetical protein